MCASDSEGINLSAEELQDRLVLGEQIVGPCLSVAWRPVRNKLHSLLRLVERGAEVEGVLSA